jgi:pimeloyl-ACP methyl ester carboxylesterase
VEPSLSTARLGFGVGSLDTDVSELSLLVGYIQSLRPHGKVVLAGHSTGCQDALHYVSAALTEKERKRTTFSPVPTSNGRRPRVDAIVLQAPVSDRIAMSISNVPESVTAEAQATAEQFVREKRGRDILPRKLTAALGHAPVSANRWLSLTSPGPEHGGLDDMFSYDLEEDKLVKTFGSVDHGVRILAVMSGKDEYVPESVDQGALCEWWKGVTRKGNGIWDDDSGVLEGSIHDLSQENQDVTREFCRRVVAFLGRVEVQGDSKM